MPKGLQHLAGSPLLWTAFPLQSLGGVRGCRGLQRFPSESTGGPKSPLWLPSTFPPTGPWHPLCCQRQVLSRTLELVQPECLLLANVLRTSFGVRPLLPCWSASRWCHRSTQNLSALPSALARPAELSLPQAATPVCIQPTESRVPLPEHCCAGAAP